MNSTESKKLSADGYLGNKFDPLSDEEIPDRFYMKDPGTMVVIPGYMPGEDEGENGKSLGWEHRAINSAADSFFFALIHKRLELTIGKHAVLDAQRLTEGGECWEKISSDKTRRYIKVSAQKPEAERYIKGIGDLQLRIDVGEENARRDLALVRHPGLMLTDTAKNLGLASPSIPPHWENFTAVLSCVPREGDLILKQCEPPSHDALSVDEIPQTDKEGRRKARKALKDLRGWLYETIKERAFRDSDRVSDARELERFGLVIKDVDSGAQIQIDPLREVNRAPRPESWPPDESTDVEEPTLPSESETEQPSPVSGEGTGGSEQGSRVREDPVTRKKRLQVELSPIFRPIKGETHKVIVSVLLPDSIKNQESMHLALKVVREDESSQVVGLMSASIGGHRLCPVEKNTFVVPLSDLDEEVKDGRVEIELSMNEPVGISSFNLAYRAE